MKSRMKNPAVLLPTAMEALQGVHAAVTKTGLSETTIGLVQIRASQINGCSVCLAMHGRHMKRAGETDERLFTIAGWRDTPFFTDAERAALGLTEALTRLADRSNPVPDALWEEVKKHYDEPTLAALILAISEINVWNRLNAATAQVVGEMKWG